MTQDHQHLIDVPEHIGAVDRTVGTRRLDGADVRVVTLERTFPADLEDVWDACTRAERIARWFAPVSGDLRLEGRYQVEGNAGGTVTSCAPPRRFEATWEFAGDVSRIEVSLSPEQDGGTRLRLEHTGPGSDEHWGQFGPGAVGVGWDLALVGLALHLRSGGAAGAEEGATWMASEEGRTFMALSSSAWGDADAAGGADEAQARAAAERTRQAFTAVPDPGGTA
jgi:uncharacterized protein YndB with AHSA1/START domain